MALFKEKEKISKKEFRKALGKRNPVVPGTYRKLFSVPEKKKMEKKLFGKREKATKKEYRKLIGEIGKEKYKATDIEKRRMISKKIRTLKRLGGL